MSGCFKSAYSLKTALSVAFVVDEIRLNRETMAISYLKGLLNYTGDINNLEDMCIMIKERFEQYDEQVGNVIIGLSRMASNVTGNIKMMKGV